MVSVNPQSLKKDIDSVRPNGYFMYDNTRELDKSMLRDDIHFIGVPMIELCRQHFTTDPRSHQLLKNMIYVGALVALLDIEVQVVKDLIADPH